MVEDMQLRNFSIHTQKAYALQVALFARHFRRSPELLGPENIRTYQLYLTKEKQWSAASIIQATAALRFLYTVTLKNDWQIERVLPLLRRKKTLPSVLSPEEVLHFLGCIGNLKQQTILTACYAAGLRVSEAVSLKACHIDSQRMVLHVEQGKGQKDRYVMLSAKTVGDLTPVVARRKTVGLVVSRPTRESAHLHSSDFANLSADSSSPWLAQDRNPALASPCVCLPFTGGRHRFTDHPVVDGSRIPVHHVAILAHRHREGLLNPQPPGSIAGSAPASTSRSFDTERL